MNFLKKLLGLGRDQFAPIIVASARAGLSAGGAVLIGGILSWLNAVDWSDYLGANAVPYAVIVGGTLRALLEGAIDQKRKSVENDGEKASLPPFMGTEPEPAVEIDDDVIPMAVEPVEPRRPRRHSRPRRSPGDPRG